MSYFVTPADRRPLQLCENETVASVLQNVRIILETPRGSCPMYREFGVDQSFLDRPIPIAKTMMLSRIREAVEEFEPRAKVVGITFDEGTPGQLIPTVEVEIANETEL